MKKITTVMLLIFALCTIKAAEGSSVSFETSIKSGNVDSDGYIYTKKPVSESDLVIELGKGFYGEIFHVGQLNMKTEDPNELKWTLGLAKEGVIDFDLSFSYDDFRSLFKGPKGDVWLSRLGLSKTFEYQIFGKIKAFGEATHYKVGRGSSFGGGIRGKIGAEYWHRILSSEFTYSIALGRDDGTYDNRAHNVINQEVGLSWKFKKFGVKLSVSNYIITQNIPGFRSSMVYGLGISL